MRSTISKTNLHSIIAASAATAALTDPANSSTKPTVAVVDPGDFPLLRAQMGGAGADDSVVNFQAYGATRHDTPDPHLWVPKILAKGSFTLGTEMQADGVRRWADTITLTTAAAGVEARNHADHIADLILPAGPFHLIVFETDVDDATSADVLTHLCTTAGGEEADEVTVVGSVTLTETSAAAILAATQTNILALSAPIALTATTTLATMLGGALNTSLKKLTLISSDPTKIAYWALGGEASAATAVLLPVGAASVELRVNKTVADTLQLFAPVSVGITVLQEG